MSYDPSADLRANCEDYCADCRRCHTFQSRSIRWGEIAPQCLLDGLADEDYSVPCQNEHLEIDYDMA